MVAEKVCCLCARRPASETVDGFSVEVAAAGSAQATPIVLEIDYVAVRSRNGLELEASTRMDTNVSR